MGWAGIGLSILGGLAALLAAFLLAMYLVGRGMPPGHRLACTLSMCQRPEAVYEAIADLKSWPRWDSGVARVEETPSPDGSYRVNLHMGGNVMALVRTVHEPPRLHEMTVEDAGRKMFSGFWRHEIAPTAEGCRVTLTEDGTIHFALPRALARKVFDPAMYLKRHLRLLAKKFGEEPRLS